MNFSYGKNVKIYQWTSIASDAEHTSRQTNPDGIVYIGDDCVIREFVTINAPVEESTVVGSHCYLMSKSHVGHDARLGDGVVLSDGACVGGHSQLGNGVYMGLNSSCHQFSKLADYCMVGANSFFKGESPPGIIWAGVPARPLKVNQVALDRSSLSFVEKEEIIKNAQQFIDNYKNLLTSK